MWKFVIGLIAFVTFGLVIISFSGMDTIKEGNRGVKLEFGKVVKEPLSPGLYFFNPFTTDIETMSVRTQKLEGATSAYTKDVQQGQVAWSLNFSLNEGNVIQMYSTVGKDYATKLIPQVIEGTLKTNMGLWEAVDLINKRESARAQIQTQIFEALQSRGINVERFEIINIDYNDEFEASVERKVIAIQDAEASQNKTVRIEEEAKQRVIAAEAEAQSIKIVGEALAENKDLVSLKAVEKWNGTLPNYMFGNSVPFVQVPTSQK